MALYYHGSHLMELTYGAGERQISPLCQILPLLPFSQDLDLKGLVSLCKASKQLRDRCLDLSDQQLQLIVQQALQQKQPKRLFQIRHFCTHPDSCCNALAWLLGTLSKRWGIMQLATRLDLQQALLTAEEDSLACYILIRAGARITRELLRASDSIMGLRAWVDAYKRLRLSYPPLPDKLMQVLKGEALGSRELQGLGSKLHYDLFGAALKIRDMALTGKLVCVLRERKWAGWSVRMVYQLIVLAVKQGNGPLLRHLLRLPVAEQITGQQYSKLLILLMNSQDRVWVREYRRVRLIITKTQWSQQLVEDLAAAIQSQASSKCVCTDRCNTCQILQLICRYSTADLTLQLQTSLLSAAARSHDKAASALLRRMARYEGVMEAADGYTAVKVALQRWPAVGARDYRHYFKQFLLQPAVQQLPLGKVQQLLQHAAASGCAKGLRCLLLGLPTAQEVTAEGYQQLLDLALGKGTRRGLGGSSINLEMLAVLVRCELSARVPPGLGQLQQMLLKCIKEDQSEVIECLVGGFKEAARDSPAAVYELLLQAASVRRNRSLVALLDLIPQLEEVPLVVLQELLPVLMKHSCPRVKLTPGIVDNHEIYTGVYGSRSCSVCSLLQAAAGKLAAADVWEVLVAAAKAQVQSIHFGGLTHLPGVDDLGNDQVEQLLLTAMEGWKLKEVPGQLLVLKIEQLQGELLFGRRLPSAAVHRLMVACVETAGYWRVGELREELGLPIEGWEGPLSQQQLEQLLQLAVSSSEGFGLIEWGARGGAHECRPGLLMLARLLPSVKERQQVVDMLWASCLHMFGGRYSFDCQLEGGVYHHALTSSSESYSDAESKSDPESDSASEIDPYAGFESDSESDSDSDADSDSDSSGW
jgi:hypothetical protein